MRILIALLLSFFFLTPGFAWNGNDNQEALLNRVTLQLNTEQWVTTQSALVNVSINAGVSDQGLDKMQAEILKKLEKISNQGTWHLVSFDRTQDQSGLEKIHISAQARIASSALAGLREKAKDITKPGETFTVDSIQFTPSEDEFRAANVELRGKIYQQAKDEVERLNKAYPDQKFYIHDINFMTGMITAPTPNAYLSVKMSVGGMAQAQQLPVGDKLQVFATVVLASVADPLITKLPH